MISLKGTGIEASTYGVVGMIVGQDGHTLVVTVPNARNSYGTGPRGPSGGKVLLGQLKGGYSANIFDMQQEEHLNLAWDVKALMAAALAAPEADRRTCA
ncbi:MAG: hypothetical protein KJ614_15075 [Gammaproteobacteria bacterium]|uniref:hypothetical protein n=1 Tax=Rhodoferax sp. TaxID=50421 RepID=UPI00182FC309|nr:hypothetical protein [Rhodoferax sp.]MBU3900220.1 hypothetical protein [Gammaproteobacteria bacterium]MBA3058798.1 hypothetical protein [Rhodoferax sp.]MBU3999544.1 hypothetical protein [Gammaproteobacteria bacterium]MBU4082284.1 hypothetical protein [Gammaproteobacteria bacterium]MBU4114157.1 hypothetical protein [Gammaproteobacteria bacterium]